MRACLINKSIVFIILFPVTHASRLDAQINTLLEGEIRDSDDSLLKGGRVYLQWPEIKTSVDSTNTDSKGGFRFQNFAFGNYSIGVNIPEVDNAVADVISINALNPIKENQHFKIDDGSLVCVESNYQNIKDALENKENVFTLDLDNLQFDVADKSLVIGTDASKKLSPKIGEFVNLESLSMNINTINSLPAEMGNLKKLTSFSASLNKLTTLPAEMESLKNLKTLNLGKNSFTVFPEIIGRYSALEVLNFEKNAISILPASINGLKSLKELNLSGCAELTSLPVQIGELSTLESLDLSGCLKLRSLPDEIVGLKNLKALDVTDTKISTKKLQEAVPGCEVRK